MAQTLGNRIATLRKAKNMTQLELAAYMNVTDKAVSKWERDLSCPDIHSINKLSEILDVSIEELMQCEKKIRVANRFEIDAMIHVVLKGIVLAMGISTVVLNILGELMVHNAITLVGIGLSAVGILLLKEK